MPLSDYNTIINTMLRDQSEQVSFEDIEVALSFAVKRYSKDCPTRVTVEVQFENGKAEMPPQAQSVLEVRSPGLSSTHSFTILDTPAGKRIHLDYCWETAIFWVVATIPHQLSGQEDTIPQEDQQAVCHFAAFKLYEDLAGSYAGDRDNMIAADSVDHGSKSAEFAKRANRHFHLYHKLLGIKPGRQKNASAVVNLNSRASGGGEFLLHRSSDR